MHEELEHIEVLQKQKRVLRKVNSVLRRDVVKSKQYSDYLFLELCSNSSDTELAMEKLWALGGFENKCGPQDYNYIVAACLDVLEKATAISRS
jgi:hypothetical protein